MAELPQNVTFVAPYWNLPGHVGDLRARRMVRWFRQGGYQVTIVRAGVSDRIEQTDFGQIITIADPLDMHPETHREDSHAAPPAVSRKPNRLRRWLAYALLLPDPVIVWARRAARHPLVIKNTTASTWFMASSPPESGFVTASKLAERQGGHFIMDMRDGWLDEPMKPLLRTSKLHRWREQRIEQRMLQKAHKVIVTSTVWRDMLLERYPGHADKVMVLTNAYPEYNFLFPTDESTGRDVLRSEEITPIKPIRFLYSGRLTSSRPERRIENLLLPLINIWHKKPFPAEFIFAGELTPSEEAILAYWASRFSTLKWKLTRVAQEPHKLALQRMQQADVLLLLSDSMGSIPAKFFDYVASGTPILAHTPRQSALDQAGRDIAQFHVLHESDAVTGDTVLEPLIFGSAGSTEKRSYPTAFRESVQESQFLALFQ